MPLPARILLVFYLATIAAPAVIMVDFVLERDRIARDLCVQRTVPEGKRTCHGQCHLAEQLKKAEGATQEDAPQPPSLRYEEQFVERLGTVLPAGGDMRDRSFQPARCPDLSDGHARSAEGVPWA